MNRNSQKYAAGMQAVNDFFEMLHQAMHTAMPSVWLGRSGAYVWRGYQIMKFQGLSSGLYYCLLYPSNPNLLIFKESYKFPGYRPADKRDVDYKIKEGDYYRAFSLELNLYRARFFLLNTEEQYNLLLGFTRYAAEACLQWQQSETREKTTPKGKLHLVTTTKPKDMPFRPFSQVEIEFLSAFSLQNHLFATLQRVLHELVPSISGREVEYIRPNAHPLNFDFRGLRLKFKGTKYTHSDYLWEIYYHKPTALYCYRYDGKSREEAGSLDIESTRYFDLSDAEKAQVLTSFVREALSLAA